MLLTVRENGLITDEAKKFIGILDLSRGIFTTEQFKDELKKTFKTNDVTVLTDEEMNSLFLKAGDDK